MSILLFFSVGFGLSIPWLAKRLLQSRYDANFHLLQTAKYSLLTSFCMLAGVYFLYYLYFPTDQIYFLFIWLYLLLFVALTDYWVGLIPNLCSYSLLLVGLLFVLLYHPQQFGTVAIRVSLCFLILSTIASWTASLGGGDVKLITSAATVLSLKWLCFALWLASIHALIWLLIGWLRGQPISRKIKIAFAPHLAVGFYIALLWEQIW